MPKLKTHKGTKKKLNIRAGGTITINKPGRRHNTGKKNAAFNRVSRQGATLSKGDKNRLKKVAL